MNKWDMRFISLVQQIATWSSCLNKNRHVGAIIVNDKRIIATGYNGAPQGVPTCVDRAKCLRDDLNITSGTCQEICYAVHAEQNAIAQAAKLGVSIKNSTLYCTHQPCSICAKIIINSGIKRVVYMNGYPDEFSLELFKIAKVKCEKFENIKEQNK